MRVREMDTARVTAKLFGGGMDDEFHKPLAGLRPISSPYVAPLVGRSLLTFLKIEESG